MTVVGYLRCAWRAKFPNAALPDDGMLFFWAEAFDESDHQFALDELARKYAEEGGNMTLLQMTGSLTGIMNRQRAYRLSRPPKPRRRAKSGWRRR